MQRSGGDPVPMPAGGQVIDVDTVGRTIIHQPEAVGDDHLPFAGPVGDFHFNRFSPGRGDYPNRLAVGKPLLLRILRIH